MGAWGRDAVVGRKAAAAGCWVLGGWACFGGGAGDRYTSASFGWESFDKSKQSCAIEPHYPAGWETRHYEPMKTVNNSSETASPRGGVGSIVRRTQSTATQVNTIRLKAWTSPRLNGEVLPRLASAAPPREPSPLERGGSGGAFWVVGGSRLSRGSAREDGRPDRKDHRRRCPSGVNRSAAEIASEALS